MNFILAPLADITQEPGAYYAFMVSDWFGRFIVVVLLLISIWAWWIMLDKGLALFRAIRLSERFFTNFANKKNIVGMLREAQNDPSPVAHIYMVGVEKLLECYADTPEQAAEYIVRASSNASPVRRNLTGAQIEAIQTVMEREVSSQIMTQEEGVPGLGIVVTLSPFLGLLGTVWGVMMAFCGVAIAGKPDFAALAPGVAGALLTTVAGLLVAIPSLIGYNILIQSTRKLTVHMDNFTEEFMTKLKLEQLENYSPRKEE